MNDSTMLNMSTYESYKDSGVHYLGDIPLGWKVTKIKHAAKINPSNHFTFSEFSDHACFLPMEAVLASGEVDYSSKRLVKDVKSGFTSFKKDDVLLAKITPCFENGKGAYLNEMPTKYGFGSTEFHVIRANKHYVPHFLYYLTKTHMFMDFGEQMMTGSAGQKRVPTAFLENFEFASPSYKEQLNIVSFLTVNIELVDEAIAIKQKQIELLKERKQIIIQQAVTQGLNPDAPMKDSGLGWLGDIPKHWKVESLKNILVERNKKNYPIESEERLSLSIDKGITLYAEKTTNLDRFKDDFSQYKLSYKGDLVFNSMNMIVGAVGVSNYFGCVSPVYYTYYSKLDNPNITKFYEYFFKSRVVQSQLYRLGKGIMAIDRGEGKFNTVRLKVSRDDLRSMKVPFPSSSEITDIVESIESESFNINESIKLQYQQIEKLKEYKNTLINSAVTGKIKVMELA